MVGGGGGAGAKITYIRAREMILTTIAIEVGFCIKKFSTTSLFLLTSPILRTWVVNFCRNQVSYCPSEKICSFNARVSKLCMIMK